jgi:hypothetical protein
MSLHQRLACILLCTAVVASECDGFGAASGSPRTQQIQLHAGWNSVFLEVCPRDTSPGVVFSNVPVTIAATYFPFANSVEFLTDPVRINWKKEGWSVWYAPRRSDSFLSSLYAVDGNRAYLLYSEQEFVWTIEGDVAFEPVRWQSDSFNHVGFGVNSQSPPTFGKFFAGSKAHAQRKFYRLVNDKWAKVTTPDATAMKSGEAFWAYCQGVSDFQGPLNVSIPAGRMVVFTGQSIARIALGNSSTDPLGVRTELAGSGLPLSYVLRGLAGDRIENIFIDLPQNHSLPMLEAGAKSYFTLQVRREQMTQTVQSTLLKISTDVGTELWLPLAAQREDLAGP